MCPGSVAENEVTAALLNRLYTGAHRVTVRGAAVSADAGPHLWHNQNGLRRPTDTAGFPNTLLWLWSRGQKTTIIAGSAASWRPASSGTSPGRDRPDLLTVLGVAEQQVTIHPLLCATRVVCRSPELADAAWEAGERPPQRLLAGQGRPGLWAPILVDAWVVDCHSAGDCACIC